MVVACVSGLASWFWQDVFTYIYLSGSTTNFPILNLIWTPNMKEMLSKKIEGMTKSACSAPETLLLICPQKMLSEESTTWTKF